MIHNWFALSMWLHAKLYSLFTEPPQSVLYKGRNLDKFYFVQFPPKEKNKQTMACLYLLRLHYGLCSPWWGISVLTRCQWEQNFPFRLLTREIVGGPLFLLCIFPILFCFHRHPLPVPNTLVTIRIRPLVLLFHVASWVSLYNGLLFPSLMVNSD